MARGGNEEAGHVLEQRSPPTAKHGTGVGAEALTPIDREAWDRSKR